MEITTFRLDGDAHARALRRTVPFTSGLGIAIVTVVLVVQGVQAQQTGDDFEATLRLVVPIASLVISATTALTFWNAGRTARTMAATFDLSLGRHVVRHSVENWVPIELLRAEIGEVKENRWGLVLLTRDHSRRLHIPRAVIGYADLKALFVGAPSAPEGPPDEVQAELEAIRARQHGAGASVPRTNPTKDVAWIVAAFVGPWIVLLAMYCVIRFLFTPTEP